TDGISEVVIAAVRALRTHRDTPAPVMAAAEAAGLRHRLTAATAPERNDAAPADIARRVEAGRVCGVCGGPPPARGGGGGAGPPALATLRSRPDPERLRERWSTYDVHVFDRP